MPGRNGTGPNGMGPGTGRGCGPCVGGDLIQPRYGMGCGRGRGFRWNAFATGLPNWMRDGDQPASAETDPQQEKMMLQNQMKMLENQLNQIRQKLEKLDSPV